ncbi:hypothetical protein [Enterococcus faecalis]
MTGSSEHLTNRTKVIHELKCNECSNTFGSTNKEQRFCSYKCKTRNRNKLNELERRKYYAEGECKIFCVNEKIHTKKEVASVE